MAEKTWINKSEKEIRDDIVAIAKEETKLTNFKSTGVLRSFVEVIAKIAIFIYASAINMIYKNAYLSGATGIFLSFWGLMLGVVRKQGQRQKGILPGLRMAMVQYRREHGRLCRGQSCATRLWKK